MITRFLSEVSASFNPFSPNARSARSILALLPANARTFMKIDVKIHPRTSQVPTSILLKFKDGKTIDLDLDQTPIKTVIELVDRHSRALTRAANLTE